MCSHTLIDSETGRCLFCDSAEFPRGPPLLDFSGIVKPHSSVQVQSILDKRLSAARETKRSHLVLDLDNTLIVSVDSSRMFMHCMKYGISPEQFIKHPDTVILKAPSPRFNDFYCKKRPGLEKFLSAVSEGYILYMYTMGMRAYAQAVLGAIDPDGRYFGNRIICRDDVAHPPGRDGAQKYLDYLFGDNTEDVIVVDDRADVWGPGAAMHQHVIQVPGYRFFPDVNMFHDQGYDSLDVVCPHVQLFIGQDCAKAITAVFDNDAGDTTLGDLTNLLLYLRTKRTTSPCMPLHRVWNTRRSKVFANCEIYPENFMPEEIAHVFCYQEVSNTGNLFGAAVVPFYRRGKTTHILCNPYSSKLPPRARISGLTDQDEVYLVHPNWFHDCIRAARSLDEAPYLMEY